MQHDNYQTIPNTPEIDQRSDRTNYTTKSREEVTLKEVGDAETVYERNRSWPLKWEERAVVTEKDQRETNIQGNAQGKQTPITIGLESERY